MVIKNLYGAKIVFESDLVYHDNSTFYDVLVKEIEDCKHTIDKLNRDGSLNGKVINVKLGFNEGITGLSFYITDNGFVELGALKDKDVERTINILDLKRLEETLAIARNLVYFRAENYRNQDHRFFTYYINLWELLLSKERIIKSEEQNNIISKDQTKHSNYMFNDLTTDDEIRNSKHFRR